MIRNFILFGLSVVLLTLGCSSGKNTLDKGNYYQAVLKSVNRLRKNPDHKKSKQTLHRGYPLAQEYYEDLANRAKTSNNQFKWERAIEQYQLLNNLNNEIQRCPACKPLAKSARSYDGEINDASLKAAEVRFALGEQGMATQSRLGAKDAFFHFQRVRELRPSFRDVNQKIMEAREMATLRVMVERIPIHSQALQLSNQFFQDKINEYLLRGRISEFVRFYSPGEAQNAGIQQLDHTVLLTFDDFVVGQHYVKETVETVTRDSVAVKKKGRGEEFTQYITVSAEYRHWIKRVESSGLLDLQVIDNRTRRVLTRDKLPGTFLWTCEWGSFNGDERAMSQAQLNICKARELLPPPPQDLFIEFTKPIYDQVTGTLTNFYRNY